MAAIIATMMASTTGSIRPMATRLARVNLRPTCTPMSANATHCSHDGRATSPNQPVAASTPETTSGPSRLIVVTGISLASTIPSARLTAVNARLRPADVSPSVRVPRPCGGWKTRAVTTGIAISTTSTRRYWTTVTTRSSAPRSRATATTPDAPPAIIAKTPVVRETSRRRASS